ncbi:MAG: hypothetical protein ACODAB_06280 [Gemmatimonadota bacterium]
MMSKLTSGLFAAALVLALPLTANAQEAAVPADEAETCTATIAPIHASEHVAATATFDAPFGNVVAIEAPAESGIVLAEEKQTEMADEGVEREPAPLAEEEENANVSKFWLDTSDATPGTYLVTLNNELDESCSAEITVEEKSDAERAEKKAGEAEEKDTEDGEEY